MTAPDDQQHDRHRHRSRLVEFFRIDAPGNHRLFSRGALSPAVAILAVMIFTLAGLVIDGGRQLGARSRAVGYAQEAARVGAAAIQLNVAEAKIDTTKAAAAISGFCAQVRNNDPAVTSCGPTTLTDKEVDIQVDIANKTTFLGLIGKTSLKASGTGQAHAEQGIEKADDSPTIPPISVNPTTDGPGAPTSVANPPTIDLPCPTWTIGSPTPIWTLSPLPFPATCSPNVTPPPDTNSSPPPSGDPSGPPSSSEPPSSTKPPGG
ncbi:TadE/TadG family type IV pilus assembly protein [Kribbella pratensis]|uniref:Flp pilus assembly protein TadG n=1 Tax=Kribbella pratensis TaxID=2512112 RepID=A0A4R8CIX4_9ACTN|nr:TadE/TadG family type IV pilus assembly protein [Kribbella pratensis]TDW76348.1 Flp pilus assembly protein TadG [Kribbella pratensis]